MIEIGISALALVIALTAIILAATVPHPESIIDDNRVSGSTVYSSLMTEKRLHQVSKKIDLDRIARKIIETDMQGLAGHVTADLMTNYLPQFSGSVAGNLIDEEQFTNEIANRLETSQVFAENVVSAMNLDLIINTLKDMLATDPEFIEGVAGNLNLEDVAQVISTDPNFREGVSNLLAEDDVFATMVANRLDLNLLAEAVAPTVTQNLANSPQFISAVVQELDVDHLVDDIAAKVVEDPNLLANVSNYLLTQTDMVNQIVAQLDIAQIANLVIQDPQLPQVVGDFLSQDENFQQVVINGLLQDPNFIPNVADGVIQDPAFQQTIGEFLIQSQEFQDTVIGGLLQDPNFIDQVSGNVAADADFRQVISTTISQDQQFRTALSGLLSEDTNFVAAVSSVVAQEVDLSQIAQIIVDDNWPQIEQLIIQTIEDQPLGQLSVNTLIVNNQLTVNGAGMFNSVHTNALQARTGNNINVNSNFESNNWHIHTNGNMNISNITMPVGGGIASVNAPDDILIMIDTQGMRFAHAISVQDAMRFFGPIVVSQIFPHPNTTIEVNEIPIDNPTPLMQVNGHFEGDIVRTNRLRAPQLDDDIQVDSNLRKPGEWHIFTNGEARFNRTHTNELAAIDDMINIPNTLHKEGVWHILDNGEARFTDLIIDN